MGDQPESHRYKVIRGISKKFNEKEKNKKKFKNKNKIKITIFLIF
jgi:hypothetical protein